MRFVTFFFYGVCCLAGLYVFVEGLAHGSRAGVEFLHVAFDLFA